MRLAYLVLDLLLVLAVLLVVGLLAAFWLPLALLAIVVGLALWLVRRYHLDYLDEPDARRRGP